MLSVEVRFVALGYVDVFVLKIGRVCQCPEFQVYVCLMLILFGLGVKSLLTARKTITKVGSLKGRT